MLIKYKLGPANHRLIEILNCVVNVFLYKDNRQTQINKHIYTLQTNIDREPKTKEIQNS